ncbi:MAG: hypothetical protein M3362_17065, partial [Acidobacteriota bacterium]|nr:hypothetical protein [Acidobacteriota bacterium]
MRKSNEIFSKFLFLILILVATIAQTACAALSASGFQGIEGRGLTNIACHDPFVVKLISEQQQWYVEIKGSRYRLSQAGDALRPIMDGRKNKTVYVIKPDGARYTVLQQFTDYAREAGVT